MPFDPIWQFLDHPLSNKEFENEDFAKLKMPSNYNFSDSIKIQNDLEPITKLLRENRRISQSGLSNKLVRERVAHNQQSIVSLKFNQAVEVFNKSVLDFNFYILSKNKQFEGTKMEDEKIIEMLYNSRQKVEWVEKTIQLLNSDNAEVNRAMKEMDILINDMKTKLTDEDIFVAKYIKTLKPFRLLLFVEI